MRWWPFLVGFATPILGVAVILGTNQQEKLRIAHPVRNVAEQLPVATPVKVAEKEKLTGCWQVESSEAEVFANWHYPCPALPSKPPVLPEVREWPESPVTLPAFHSGEPDLSRQVTTATLTESKATKGAGGLLFLPASSGGEGYYVAAYQEENGRSGWAIGAYGVPPVSVPTPIGRVYLQEGFKTKPVVRRRAVAHIDKDIDEAATAPTYISPAESVSADKTVRPRALEFDN